MRGGSAALLMILALTSVARADDVALYERFWPSVPKSAHEVSMEDQLTDTLTALGNTLGYHLDVLSADMLALKFDGRHNRAHLRFGTIDSDFVSFKFDSVVQFGDGLAQIHARFVVGVGGHFVHVDLPEIVMTPTDYHGEDGVALLMPFYRRSF